MKKLTLHAKNFPRLLKAIPGAPQELYVLGDSFEDLMTRPCLAVVGSRRASPYGRRVTDSLVSDLSRQGMVIVSGLAYGIDSIAHASTLAAGGKTIAVLPGGLDNIYPVSHQKLAEQILTSGGALVSEYPPGTSAYKHHFIARNRIISGLSSAVLITEAAEKSGSLHTANFALEQGRDVMAVPGSIYNQLSAGTNRLIRTGATPITCAQDVLDVLGLEQIALELDDILAGRSPAEQKVLGLLGGGSTDDSTLFEKSRLDVSLFNRTLTGLEIAGIIKRVGASTWALRV